MAEHTTTTLTMVESTCMRCQMKGEVLLLRVHDLVFVSKMADAFVDETTKPSTNMDVEALPLLEILI